VVRAGLRSFCCGAGVLARMHEGWRYIFNTFRMLPKNRIHAAGRYQNGQVRTILFCSLWLFKGGFVKSSFCRSRDTSLHIPSGKIYTSLITKSARGSVGLQYARRLSAGSRRAPPSGCLN
jgi:hypothetical protein